MISSINLTQVMMNKMSNYKMHSSVLYTETWKSKCTPQNILYYSHTASSTRKPDILYNMSLFEDVDENNDINSKFTHWPTPLSRDYKGSSGRSMKGIGIDTPTAALLVGWLTPKSTEIEENPAKSSARLGDRSDLTCTSLSSQSKYLPIYVSGWLTPIADNAAGGKYSYGKLQPNGEKEKFWKLPGQVDLVYNNTSTNEAFAPNGKLNPRLSGWLMGYPVEWCIAAISSTKV